MGGDPNPEKSGSESWERSVASAEVSGRRVNEAIERGAEQDAAVFVCECGHLGCSTTIELSMVEYEAVRTNFDRFLLMPGHEIERIDEIVERHPNHLVIVKRAGEARRLAAITDERPR
jgi:hypothetical protein